jgi:RHS repeat-associated protein
MTRGYGYDASSRLCALPCGVSGFRSVRSPFTAKERDAETGTANGNDYFGARYYASSMGRFLSPDPYAGSMNPSFPQSFNRYIYAANNPLRFTDPTGLDCVYMNDAGDAAESVDHHSNSRECGKNGGDWVGGYTQEDWVGYDATKDKFTIGSVYNGNVGMTGATAPHGSGFWATAFGCTGNCTGSTSYIDFWTLQGQLAPTGTSVTDLLVWATNQTSIPSWNPNIAWSGGQGLGSMGATSWYVQWATRSKWSGPGGYGTPRDDADWSFIAHDFQYAMTHNTYPGINVDPLHMAPGGPQLQKINQQLCDHSAVGNAFFSNFSDWGCH